MNRMPHKRQNLPAKQSLETIETRKQNTPNETYRVVNTTSLAACEQSRLGSLLQTTHCLLASHVFQSRYSEYFIVAVRPRYRVTFN